MKVITHNGVFHADEVTAIALIELTKAGNNTVEIVRSRDASLWATHQAMPGSNDLPKGVDYVIDVGGINNRQWRLDHHQLEKGDVEYGISSAGLVWKYVVARHYATYGTDYYGEYDGTGKSADEANPVLAALIKKIDANDTGAARADDLYHEVIRALNGVDPYNQEEQDRLFRVAINFSKDVIRRLRGQTPKCDLGLPMTIERASQMALTHGEVSREIKINKQQKLLQAERYEIAIAKAERRSDGIIKFDKGESYVPVSELIGKAHISIQWDSAQECWSIQTIPIERGGFKSKFKLVPIGDEIFCHPAGFISKTKTGGFYPVEQW